MVTEPMLDMLIVFFKPNRNWSVKGKHTYEFSLGGDIGYRETLATDCNATQGWPW